MPYKPQTQCYRTINNVRYLNWCDVLDAQHFAEVKKVKRLRVRHRLIKHPDGYRQLFIHPDDVSRLHDGAQQKGEQL